MITDMIEVFKTNVRSKQDAARIVKNLKEVMVASKINFDLEDCDKILRIERTSNAKNNYILRYMKQLGYNCEILE
ncbi:hypothetical protein [Flavobacterium wongokense]|uniref:hypothetical protein n=1 Tax=Flavobacterium wongokense TaxID=2910674 RepID=UPI001F449C3D|nr:hypothetical protein [Flavobacterium sp. WG47]MCF6132759.1 hypothetical protein [Flavobacterium sp. WG47]